MKFCNAKILADKAREGGWAVPAFNANGGNYDIARAAVEAAEELRSPLIMMEYEPNVAYRGYEYCVLQAAHLAQDATIPIAVHLDHGTSFASVLSAVRAGFTSVMIDCSHLPLEENVRGTRQVIEAVRPLGVSVEAELGHVAGGVHSSGGAASTTDPEEAVRFAEESGVDMLAIANGTRHGIFERQEDVDLDLVKRLRQAVPVPLVQHGTCGISLELMHDLAAAGMAKFNFGEGARASYIAWFKEYADTMDHKGHPWKIMQAVKERLKEDMKDIIRALGSEGKAERI
ncbi:MAG: class II fructose-bisphosphate aldolase [Armatimonadota bacterium]